MKAVLLLALALLWTSSAFAQKRECYIRTQQVDMCHCLGTCSSDSEPFSPLLPAFEKAQNNVANSLRDYGATSSASIREVTRYLLERMPRANPTTLSELDNAAEDLALFFEGYRRAYQDAADRVAKAERELVENQREIAWRHREIQKNRAYLSDWEQRGGPKLMARFEQVVKYKAHFDRGSYDTATSLINKIEKSPYRDPRVWKSFSRDSVMDRMYKKNVSPPELEKAKEMIHDFKVTAHVYRAVAVPPMRLASSNILPAVSLNRSRRVTAEERIRENLAQIADAFRIDGGEPVDALRNYFRVSIDGPHPEVTENDPAKLLDAYSESRRVSAVAEKELGRTSTLRSYTPPVDDISGRLATFKATGVETAVRWAFWKGLERSGELFLKDKLAQDMFKRFVKVQEQVVGLAEEDMKYLPAVAEALAHGSLADIEALRRDMEMVFCKYSVAFGTTAWPLPSALTKEPVARFMPSGATVCN